MTDGARCFVKKTRGGGENSPPPRVLLCRFDREPIDFSFVSYARCQSSMLFSNRQFSLSVSLSQAR